MKKLTQEAFRQAVNRGAIEPLYLFTGRFPQQGGGSAGGDVEEYLQRQAVQALTEQVVDAATRAFNFVSVSAEELTLAEIVDVARQLPAFASRRLILVRDLEKVFRRGSADPEEANTGRDTPGLGEFIEYLKHPCETTTMVVLWAKPDRRLNLTTALLKSCVLVEFPPLEEGNMTAWVRQYLQSGDCYADDASIAELVDRVGTDLTLMANELDKLVTYVRRGPIGKTEVETLVPRWKEHSNFELTDYILERNTSAALKLLKRQLDDRQEPVMVLGAIGRLYRQMLAAKDLMIRQAPNAEVIRAAGLPPKKAGEFNKSVLHIPVEEILTGIGHIAAVDRAIKSSLGPSSLQLEILVYQLCCP